MSRPSPSWSVISDSPKLPPQRFHRRRKRGELAKEEDKLRACYDVAVAGRRRGSTWIELLDLFNATGDPLARQNPDLAARTYGLSSSARPNVTLRRIRAQTFGDPLSCLVDMAIWFHERHGWSVLHSAGEAVALAAIRGTWLGNKAPMSFDRAVELTRKAVGHARTLGRLRYQPHGWTGHYLFVTPAPDRLVTVPAPAPPRTRLPLQGSWVKDDAYWRHCIQSGDVLLKTTSIENHPTVDEVVTAA